MVQSGICSLRGHSIHHSRTNFKTSQNIAVLVDSLRSVRGGRDVVRQAGTELRGRAEIGKMGSTIHSTAPGAAT